MSRGKMTEFLIFGHLDFTPGSIFRIRKIKEYLIKRGPVGKAEIDFALTRLKTKIDVAYEDLLKEGKIDKQKFNIKD